MDHLRNRQFLSSQLFTLVALESVKTSAPLNEAAAAACDAAICVTASAIDKFLADNQTLELDADAIIASFEVPSGKAAA